MAPETEHDHAFAEPFDQIFQYPAGLYTSCTDRLYKDAFEDECELVLSFGLGANGHARKSDGSRFGENRQSAVIRARDRYVHLYQPGYQPFTDMHPCRLFSVLHNWLGMVRRGD
jgi:hypothetical protein